MFARVASGETIVGPVRRLRGDDDGSGVPRRRIPLSVLRDRVRFGLFNPRRSADFRRFYTGYFEPIESSVGD